MRSVISYIVVAALTLHALLGCCWHHAHASTEEVVHVDAEKPASVGHCCCHHHHDDVAVEHDDDAVPDAIETPQLDQDRQAPVPCSDSCGVKCQFVSTNRTQIEQPVVQHDIWLPSATIPEIAGGICFVRFETRRTTAPPLPIRLHLWNQLLLI